MSTADIDRIGNVLVRAAHELAENAAARRRRVRKGAAIGLITLVTLALGVAVAGAAGAGPLADLLGVFRGDAGMVDAEELPAPVQEVAKQVTEEPMLAQEAAGELQPADNPTPPSAGPDLSNARLLLPDLGSRKVSIYAFPADGRVCAVLSAGIGGCTSELTEARSLSIHQSVEQGRTYVWGLAADDVTSVTVLVDDWRGRAQLARNAFFVELPRDVNEHAAMRVEARTANGNTLTIALPGIPRPVPAVSQG